MSEVTLEQIHAKQAEIAAMIARLQLAPSAKFSVPAVEFDLDAGERHAGAVLDAEGRTKHHLILLPQRPDEQLDWPDAMAWAETTGGVLPTRQEQALLFANCKKHLEAGWHWSSETEGSSYAWYCDFITGGQHCGYRSFEGCAVAVRRFIP